MPYVETHRSVVAPADCDILGHMNVSRYFAAVSDGMFSFQTGLGLGLSDLRDGRRLSFAVVRAESDFKAEIMAGTVIVLRSGIAEMGTKTALFRHRLFRAEDDALTFETTFRCVLLDLANRRAAEIPDDIREKAQAFMIGDGG